MLREVLTLRTQYTLSLAAQTNSVPLPPVPEVFGVRLPPASECLTSVDFDLVPNKPPPGVKLYDEEFEEVEESEDEDEDMEAIPTPAALQPPGYPSEAHAGESSVPPVHTPQDVEMLPPSAGAAEEGSEEEAGDLFSGGEEEEESGDDAMDVSVPAAEATNGVKRKLVEEEDYD